MRGAEGASGEQEEMVVTKKVRGFSDSEIRRFVKSYRKFGKTKSRYIPLYTAKFNDT